MPSCTHRRPENLMQIDILIPLGGSLALLLGAAWWVFSV